MLSYSQLAMLWCTFHLVVHYRYEHTWETSHDLVFKNKVAVLLYTRVYFKIGSFPGEHLILNYWNKFFQQMAVRCWCLDFRPSDHLFLHKSHVFTNISKILSKSDEGWGVANISNDANKVSKIFKEKLNILWIPRDIYCILEVFNRMTTEGLDKEFIWLLYSI
jgi:hypothetical protein